MTFIFLDIYLIDTCIQPPKSVHKEENVVVSEVIELLIGSAYKLQLSHIETIAKEASCTSEDLSKIKYANFKCLKSKTCKVCKKFRIQFKRAYKSIHLYRPLNTEFVTSQEWIELIKQKFDGSNFDFLSEQITKYSSYDFEVELRNIFEDNYIMLTEKGHIAHKERLKKNSIMGSVIDTNYWFLLIFEIMLRQNFPVENTSNSLKKIVEKPNLELFTGEKMKHFSDDKNLLKKSFLNSMGICYANLNLNSVEFERFSMFGDNFASFKLRNNYKIYDKSVISDLHGLQRHNGKLF